MTPIVDAEGPVFARLWQRNVHSDSLLAEGCRDALVVGRMASTEGRNRLAIARREGMGTDGRAQFHRQKSAEDWYCATSQAHPSPTRWVFYGTALQPTKAPAYGGPHV